MIFNVGTRGMWSQHRTVPDEALSVLTRPNPTHLEHGFFLSASSIGYLHDLQPRQSIYHWFRQIYISITVLQQLQQSTSENELAGSTDYYARTTGDNRCTIHNLSFLRARHRETPPMRRITGLETVTDGQKLLAMPASVHSIVHELNIPTTPLSVQHSTLFSPSRLSELQPQIRIQYLGGAQIVRNALRGKTSPAFSHGNAPRGKMHRARGTKS
ncbi:hypothetical protein PT974_05644 [Cladobotryum mycophilum]|uniref:Uncharacterized protein n=1 Tax=Cladobotryum mycophilum TaxID=491253 RepID=A0ABR0SJA7_9HYPO